MDTTRVKLDDVRRGSLVQSATGFMVAEDVAYTWEDDPRPYLRDTNGGRHFPDARGTVEIGIPGFRVHESGRVTGRDAKYHILLNAVPGQPPAGLCPASRNLGDRMTVWSSGTALAGITCQPCRWMARLAGTYGERKRTGI